MREAKGGYPPAGKAWLSTMVIFLLTAIALADRMAISMLIGPIKAGRLRALAISSDRRIPGIDIPTLREGGIDVELANWRSVVAPPGLSTAQRQTLLDAVDRMVRSPQWRATLAKNDWVDFYLPGDAFSAYLRTEEARVTDILKSIGLAK